MAWNAEQNIQIRPAEGTSSESSICVPTSAGCFIGDKMKQIPLTQGQFAIVDDRNFKELSKYKWFVMTRKYTSYAARHTGKYPNQQTIMMHNEISQPPKGMLTDHKNRNGLDNRECNLRHCTKAQNEYNSRQKSKQGYSKYKGVTWGKRNKNHWMAQINKGPKHYHLGCFESEIEAARAYDTAAKELFGEFAFLNLGG